MSLELTGKQRMFGVDCAVIGTDNTWVYRFKGGGLMVTSADLTTPDGTLNMSGKSQMRLEALTA